MYAIVHQGSTDDSIGLIGQVQSLHRTADAADKKTAKAQRDCRRANGPNTYLPEMVVNLGDHKKKVGDNVYRDELRYEAAQSHTQGKRGSYG